MEIGRIRKKNVRFSMTSMTDIIFILLIFVVVVARYVPNAIPIDLPKSVNTTESPDGVHVTVTADYKYYVEGKICPFERLNRAIKEQLDGKKQKVVVLHMDRRLSIDHMTKVADIATVLGAQVNLETKSSE